MKRTGRGVQRTYTWPELKNDVLYRHDPKSGKMSLRQIAKIYGVNHAVIQRIINGHEPQKTRIRAALGLSPMVLTPSCPKCGAVHTTKICRTPRPSSNPQLLRIIREITVPFLEARQKK